MKNRSKQIAAAGSNLLAGLAAILLLTCGQTLANEITAAPIPYATEQVINDGDSDAVIAEKAAKVLPRPNQTAWMQLERTFFLHFGVNTFNEVEWGSGREEPSIFNPTALDANQWLGAVKNFGGNLFVLVCKHHDGFCLWPTRYTPHSVVASPWRGGKGDEVREVAEAARAHGVKLAVYLSPADLYQLKTNPKNPTGYYGNGSSNVLSVIPTDPASFQSDPAKGRAPAPGFTNFTYVVDDYNRYFLNQLYELLTEYGPIAEVWFDGANPDPSVHETYNYAAWYDLIRSLQPNAVIMGKGPDVRWVGNEGGVGRTTEWSVVPLPMSPDQCRWPDLQDWNLGGRDKLTPGSHLWWYPAEINVTILDHGQWFWAHGKQPRSISQLVDIYYTSIGRNGNLILNLSPDSRGLIPDDQVLALSRMAQVVKETFATNLADGGKLTADSSNVTNGPLLALDSNLDTWWEAAPGKTNGTVTLTLSKAVTFDVVSLQEAVDHRGQRIESFVIETWNGSDWTAPEHVSSDSLTTVGHRRLIRLKWPVTTDKVRIRITGSRLEPTLAEIGLFRQSASALPPVISDRSTNGLVTLYNSAGCRMVYTTDGTTPTTNSAVYNSPIAMMSGGTVQAACWLPDGQLGILASKSFAGLLPIGWKVVSVDSQETAGADNSAANAIDNNSSTFWHTRWSSDQALPHHITIDMGNSHRIGGFTYLPRQDGNPNGTVEKYRFETSADGVTWTTNIADGSFANIQNNPSLQEVSFAPVNARCFRFTSLQAVWNSGWTSAAEISVILAAFEADETCAACGQDAGVSGDFAHRKDDAALAIEGADNNAAAFREEIYGSNFTVTIAHLPAGKYTISIGEAETWASAPGERIFSVTSGDTVLAKDFDIVAAAGGARKVCYITGVVEHQGDSIRGPLAVSFTTGKDKAKFNTFEVKNDSGAPVVSFSASEMAEHFSAEAMRVPDLTGPTLWRDPAQPLPARANNLIRRMSLAEKVEQLQNDAPAIPRLGLPAYNYWSEALHGVAANGDATVFPQAIGAAATWDPALILRESAVIGIEGRAKFNDYASRHNGDAEWFGGLTFWSPNINIFRDPRWGRGQETYGEDPFLSGTIGVAFIKGLQGDDPNHMLAMGCAKHYAVHSGPEPDRHRFDAVPGERDLYETYLPQFEMAVREGRVGGVMGAYNAIDGVPACANYFLLTDLLRKQWGFDGYVVSDCGAIHNIWGAQEHHYVATPEEAAAAAVKAGCNLCCGGDYIALARAVQKGLITDQEIDQALYHTLWTRFKLGLFDPPEDCPYAKIGIDQNDTPEHQALALKVAEEAIVLLKNNGVLPLNRSKIKRIAVIGPNADAAWMLEGNYNGHAARPVTILKGIQDLAGPGIEVTCAAGCPWALCTDGSNQPTPEAIADAVARAKAADVVVFVGGISARLEGEEMGPNVEFDGFVGGDRTRIELPAVQTDLIRALAATRKPVILVNCSGSPMAMPWEAKHLPAILQAWYPGEQGGRAVGEILFGDVNPSGRLPVTFYASTADLPGFADYSMSNRTYRYFNGRPQFAFGHGLSYSRFKFKNGSLAAKTIPAGGTAQVSFTVKNTGKRDGDEVAQVYFRHVHSRVPQPKLALCGFARVRLKHGESSRVTVEVPATRLRYWDTQKKQYVVESGDYEFLVGAASDDIRLKLPMTVTAE